jgi:hypothetical protein
MLKELVFNAFNTDGVKGAQITPALKDGGAIPFNSCSIMNQEEFR